MPIFAVCGSLRAMSTMNISMLGWATAHGADIFPPEAKTPGTERDSHGEVMPAGQPAA